MRKNPIQSQNNKKWKQLDKALHLAGLFKTHFEQLDSLQSL